MAVLVVLAAGLDLLGVRVIPAPSSEAVGAGGRQNLVDRLVSRISGGDRRGWYRMALAARHGGPAGGAGGADRTGAARPLPLRDLSGGGLPCWPQRMAPRLGGDGIASSPSRSPSAGYPLAWKACASSTSATSTSATSCPARRSGAVDLANTVKPDLAVLTGDLITSERDPLGLHHGVEPAASALGVWGHGNHERWSGVEARARRSFSATACTCCGSNVWSCPGTAVPSI